MVYTNTSGAQAKGLRVKPSSGLTPAKAKTTEVVQLFARSDIFSLLLIQFALSSELFLPVRFEMHEFALVGTTVVIDWGVAAAADCLSPFLLHCQPPLVIS